MLGCRKNIEYCVAKTAQCHAFSEADPHTTMSQVVFKKSYGLILQNVFIVSCRIAKRIREIVSNKGEV